MGQEWTNSAGLPKQVADEQAAYGVLLVCPEEKNFVKLRDLPQDRLQVCLQEALAGHGCGRRAGDGEKDLLTSLAIRLEQCQGLFQLASVLIAAECTLGNPLSPPRGIRRAEVSDARSGRSVREGGGGRGPGRRIDR